MRQSFNELQLNDGNYRPLARGIGEWLGEINADKLSSLNDQASDIFYRKGVTFTVYNDANNIERMIPFDIIPRLISLTEWQHIEAGCKQRIRALNAFIHDIYHSQAIIKAGIVPSHYVYASGCYEPWMINIQLDKPVYSHISGIDLIRDESGNFCVLEDNLRTPSGVSYMLESRAISQMLLGDLYQKHQVLEVADYPLRLKACLSTASAKYDPQIVVLTPGRFNSAYYEHAFLARAMNVPLVHGYDLVVEDSKVYMQGVRGKLQVDVIYRRVDDPFLDPLAFRSDSILGVSGLMSAYRAGNVIIANAPGTGVADDKSLYPFVPEMIKFYLGETPILPNVETYQCGNADELNYVLNNLDKLVVKETQGSGGYGMLIGPTSTKAEIAVYRERLLTNPSGFIAQPTIALSTNPTFVGDGIAPRHIDLRPFVLSHGNGEVDIVPGGLTRVAMVEGSLVVNSSQGGGVKDTWVVDEKHIKVMTASSLELNTATNKKPPMITFDQPSQPVEVGYDDANAPLILLLSTANSLIWLGRYSERLDHYGQLVNDIEKGNCDDLNIGETIQKLGLQAKTCKDVLTLLDNELIPQIITHIENNVQDVKGVIGRDSAELYNLIKRLANSGTYRAATLQLHACNAAMEQEHEIVKLFWQLGSRFEILDRTILMKENHQKVSVDLSILVKKLPENTRWREMTRLTNQLVKSADTSAYWKLNREFNTILQQGV